MELDFKKQIRIRAGHRSYIKKLVATAEGLTKAEDPDINYVECMKITMSERMSTLQNLDDAILQLVKEENIEKEIEEAGEFRESIQISMVKINTLLKKLQVTTSPTQNNSVIANGTPVNIVQSQQEATALTESTQVRTKLPKLTLNKFHGDPKVWNEWWDSYKCAVHDNAHISEVEKLNYLRSLLQGVAASSIAGLQLTAANYSVALNLLKERFAQEQTIINAHMDALLKLQGSTSTSEVNKIREVYDGIEIHVRGLQTLGVKSEQYGTLLIPIIMSKIPEELRLILSRQISKENWNLDEILKQLKAELEARERCANAAIKDNSKEVNFKSNGGRSKGNYPSAAALTTQEFKVTCTYCKKSHPSAKCDVVTDIQARKDVLRKEGRCFVCLRKSHMAKDCQTKSCFKCNKRHHPSICEPRFTRPNRL